MTHQEFLSSLETIALSFSKLMGHDTEIAIHDLKERKLVYIVNGHVTGRQIGYKMAPSIYNTILSHIDENDAMIGYSTHSAQGSNIRASHIVVRDSGKNPIALICVNQDTSKLEEMRDLLNTMIDSKPIEQAGGGLEEDDFDIQRITQRIILDTIERSKPSSLNTKEKKIEIIETLESKGVFTVKDAVPIVCKMLSISQATLYNYLRELRSQNGF